MRWGSAGLSAAPSPTARLGGPVCTLVIFINLSSPPRGTTTSQSLCFSSEEKLHGPWAEHMFRDNGATGGGGELTAWPLAQSARGTLQGQFYQKCHLWSSGFLGWKLPGWVIPWLWSTSKMMPTGCEDAQVWLVRVCFILFCFIFGCTHSSISS